MQQLPNNCRAGKMSVFPANWKSSKANSNIMWRLSYWFYDDNLNSKRKVVIKGMNNVSTLKEKQALMQLAIDDEKYQLITLGYNQISKSYYESNEDITENTPLLKALEWALDKKVLEPETKTDIKSVLKFFSLAVKALHYDHLPIGKINRKHIVLALYKCGEIKPKLDIIIDKKGNSRKGIWSANQFNHYRKSLSLLFRILVKVYAISGNPVTDIDKESQLKKIRKTLSADQRSLAVHHLHENYYTFWRFIQIFFHSGARIIELLKLRKKDVDLNNQTFKIIVKKGKHYSEELRTIKTIALPYWIELLKPASNEQFIFSKGLSPGDVSINRWQVTKRWRVHVKGKLGITADLYSLKHSNLDEIAAMLGMKDAQAAAGHHTPVVTMAYTTGEKLREHNRLKEINNAL